MWIIDEFIFINLVAFIPLYVITKVRIPDGPMKIFQLEKIVIGMISGFSTSNEQHEDEVFKKQLNTHSDGFCIIYTSFI